MSLLTHALKTPSVQMCVPDRLYPSQEYEPCFEAVTETYVDPEGCIDCGAWDPAFTSDSIYAPADVAEDKQDFIVRISS